MSSLAVWLLTAALSLTVLIPLAWCLSLILRRWSSARIAYAAWLIPLTIMLPAGLVPAIGIELPVLIVDGTNPGGSLAASAAGYGWPVLLTMIWLIGSLLVAVALTIRQWRFVRGLNRTRVTSPTAQNTQQITIPVRYSKTCKAPMLVGVFPPRLYLPASN